MGIFITIVFLVIPFPINYLSYATAGILNIPLPSRDQVNVAMGNGLPSGFAIINSNVKPRHRGVLVFNNFSQLGRKLPLFVNISKVEFSGHNMLTGDSDEEITLH